MQDDVAACEQCGSTSRVGRGFCLNCLLHRGLGADTENTETLEGVLDEVDVRDADWRIGNYQILEEIGRGGMGVIYRARQRHSRRIVALKRILSFHADSRETLARFRREAEAAASLDHPNILPIYEVSESDDGLPFFSMKFAAGGSLVDVARTLRHDPRQIVRLTAKVTRAVQHAHAQGILHRDLKPGNILLDGRGEPLVSDFGLAKWLDANSDLTRTLTIFGTPGYIAPEQAQGPAKNLTATADIYSIGAVLFDLFTGRPPFLGEHALAVIKQAGEKAAPKLRTLAPLVDRDLETICARCLEREAHARYRSAGALADDLERWLEGRPIIARPVSSPVRVWRWSKRNPKLAGTMAAAVFLGAIGVIAAFSSSRLLSIVRTNEITNHSVAIAPFEDIDALSTSSEDARRATRLITDGLQHEKGLYVNCTTARFPENAEFWKPEDWSKVGTEMSAREILTGTIRQRNDKRRVVVRIVEPTSGAAITRRVYEFDEKTNGYEPVVAQVAAELRQALAKDAPTKGRGSSLEALPNSTAIEYLKAGKEYYFRFTPAETKTAIHYFEKAIRADPHFAEAQAYFGLAWGRRFQHDPEEFTEERRAKALTAAFEAVRLDPMLAVGYRAQAALTATSDVAQSQEAALCALELEPESVVAAGFVGYGWRMRGRPDLALRWLQRSVRGQRPGTNAAGIADALTELGEDEAAEKAYKQHFEFWPDVPDSHVGLARLAMFHGDFARALDLSEEAAKRYPDHSYSRQMKALVNLFARDFTSAEKAYRQLLEIDRKGGATFYCSVSNLSAMAYLRSRGGDSEIAKRFANEATENMMKELRKSPQNREFLYDLAATLAFCRKPEESIQTLNRAVEAGWLDHRSLALDPRFDSIKNDDRFTSIIKNLITKVTALRKGQQPEEKLARNTER
jgi:serine/threonine protein kinase/tetratricopeptide (TPR) repeat protein